jgi:hypothetical protein
MLNFISIPSAGCSSPSSPSSLKLPLLPTKSTRGGIVLPPDLQHPGTQNPRTGCPFWVGRMPSIQLSDGSIDHIICSALGRAMTSLVSLAAGCTTDTTLRVTYINMLSIGTRTMSSLQLYVDVGRGSSRETLLFCSNSTKVSRREISISISIFNVPHWSWSSSTWQIQPATANMP